MPRRKPKITAHGLEVLQRLKDGIRETNSLSVTHRVPVTTQDDVAPHVFTVDVFREPGGMFVASCWQLPLVIVSGVTEEHALAKAEADIKLLLAARRGSGST